MKTLYICIFLFLFSIHSIAEDFWMQMNRPTGGMVFSLAVNNKNEVFAGMGNGVYLSNDDGETWEHIGLLDNTVHSLLIHQNGNIFAGTGGSTNLYRMDSIGGGWTPLIWGIGNVISIMSNSSGDLFIGTWGEIYKSTDNGDNWAKVFILDNTQVITSIVENIDGTMFAGVTSFIGLGDGGGVYRSFDNGDTWEHSGLTYKYIWSLAINSNGVIFAGSRGDHYLYYGGLYMSDDNGDTWVELRNDVLVTSIVITPNDVIYIGCTNEHGHQGGVFRSFDDGETWELINSGLVGWTNQDIKGLSLSPDGYLYAYRNHLHRSVNPVIYTIDATANPPDGGTVTGAGKYHYGKTVELTATSNTGYDFINWTDEDGTVLTTDSIYSFVVEEDKTLTANFQLQQFEVSAEADPPEGGTITGAGEYYYGDTAELIATSNTGYAFINWTDEDGTVLTADSIYSFVVEQDKTLTANFQLQQFEVSAEADPPEGGTVTGAGEYYYGDTAKLTATTNEWYVFINWTDEDGTVLNADSIYSFVVEEDRTLTANFQLQQFEVSAEADPPEGGTVTGAGEYYYGDTAELIATSNTGYDFINWTDEEENVLTTDSIYSFVVESDRELTANFQLTNYVFPVNNFPITLYPNPFRDYLNIQIPRNYIYAKTLNVAVYNMTGELVYHKSMSARQDLSINLTALKPGTYTLVIVMDRQQITKRIMKLNK